jgi:hypothetical protein
MRSDGVDRQTVELLLSSTDFRRSWSAGTAAEFAGSDPGCGGRMPKPLF